MDLSTTYLGLELPHPFMPGASPMADDLDTVKRLEDAGAAAIVLRSLFEEQITTEGLATHIHLDTPKDQFAEAMSYFPEPEEFRFGPDEYLEQLREVKEAVSVPVIASLNGTTAGGWLEYGSAMAEAGADALELNVYQLPTDPEISGAQIEDETVAMVRDLTGRVEVPVALKLSPFYSSLAGFAARLEEAGAAGVVLFNRFYQADIDIEELETTRTLHLSDSSELLLRLRWLAILAGRRTLSLAASGGVHTATDALKATMAGADAIQMVSALLQRGPHYLDLVRRTVARWLEEHEYDSLGQARGSMSLLRSPDPSAFERANYMQILQSWQDKV